MQIIEYIAVAILAIGLIVAVIEFIKFEIWWHDHRKRYL